MTPEPDEIGIGAPTMGDMDDRRSVVSLPAVPGATETGLDLPPGLGYEDWRRVGHALGRMGRAVQWWVGDWLIYGEHFYGEKYAQAATETGLTEKTLANCQWVAGNVDSSRRRENLSFGHHDAIAGIHSKVDADAWLDTAEAEGWSVAELRRRIRLSKNAQGIDGEGCTIEDFALLPDGQFGTVYADPPWLYGNQATRAATGNHYDGMTIEELCAIPVAQKAAPNAHLHLWTTNAFLFDAKAVMEAWGFTYKSCFVWVKPQMGIGNYWRVSHEFMLFGIRGEAPFRDRSLMSWLEAPRGVHSAKPDQVRSMIERASPGPYLEMFGRRAVEGWTVWGNEVSRDLLTQHIKEVA